MISSKPSRGVRARAPLRLGLAGGGTDVAPFCDDHGGCVMNAAIDLYATAHIEARDDGRLAFVAADLDESWDGPATARVEPVGPTLLHKGVYNRMIADYNGGRPLPVTVTTTVEVPAGSGLGSSSALVVALVEAYRALLDAPLGEYEIARLAFDIERRDLGLAGGRQDQYAAAFGGFNFMEFGAEGRTVVNPLRVREPVELELETSILLCYSGQSRSSAAIIEEQQRNMRAASPTSIDSLFELKDEAVRMKEAILLGDFDRIADTLRRGWEAKLKTAAGISTGTIDRLIGEAMGAGARAGKVSGAGGGGFVLLLVDPARRHHIARHVEALGALVVPCRFVSRGVTSWRWT